MIPRAPTKVKPDARTTAQRRGTWGETPTREPDDDADSNSPETARSTGVV
jgi:hypothetical protein